MKHKRYKKLFTLINQYLIFFFLVAFVITCCMMLFVSTLSETLNIELNNENLSAAAKLTFANVVVLSLIYTLIDYFRRKYTVSRPVRKITEATEKMMKGDFDVRIEPIGGYFADESFNQIIAYVNKMAEELSGVETLRTDFITNVSHEMKTPLAVMQNYGTLLQTPDLTDEKRIEYAKAVTEGSRRLASLMTNILKLSKLENQQIFPQSKSYDLGEQLCECLLQFEHIWEEKNIDIETDIAENIRITADDELLCLVWSNLLSNAFKFTGSGGKVTLSLAADKEYVAVKVADTGCGMSGEVGAHIFEKFYQGDTSHATQGNGLGLALVKRIMDITGGEISVSSTLGEGTAFTVSLRRYSDGEA